LRYDNTKNQTCISPKKELSRFIIVENNRFVQKKNEKTIRKKARKKRWEQNKKRMLSFASCVCFVFKTAHAQSHPPRGESHMASTHANHSSPPQDKRDDINARLHMRLMEHMTDPLYATSVANFDDTYWLTDSIVNVYTTLLAIKSIQTHKDQYTSDAKHNASPPPLFLDSFFVPQLLTAWHHHAVMEMETATIRVDPRKRATDAVSNRKMQKLAANYLLHTPHSLVYVPVNLQAHWILYVVDTRNRCVWVYDSFTSKPKQKKRAWLLFAPLWFSDDSTNDTDDTESTSAASSSSSSSSVVAVPPTTHVSMPSVSMQDNAYDCGMFMLMTMDFLAFRPEWVPHIHTKHMPYYRASVRKSLQQQSIENSHYHHLEKKPHVQVTQT
jgi:Ulp1 family protease